MRALVLHGPGIATVDDVPRPEPGAGQVVVTVQRVGVCGTDAEFFRGTQPYLHDGGASYPLRIGHEWCGWVARVGPDVDTTLLGCRVSGDTMLGCQNCEMCRRGRQHLCPDRYEIGVRGGWPGALADEVLVPAFAVHRLPPRIGPGAGALVEPGSLALRAVSVLDLPPGERLLVWGTGAIGLLVVAFGAASGLEVHAVGRRPSALAAATKLGATRVWLESDVADMPAGQFEAAVAASPDATVPQACAGLLRAGGRLVLIGISGAPSPLESRDLVVNDLTVTGLLSGSTHFEAVIDRFANPEFDLEAVTGTVIGPVVRLDEIADILGGGETGSPEVGPKVQVELN